MKEDEKQRKFHERLIKLLYPPSPPYHSDHDEKDEEAPEGKESVNLVDGLQDEQANEEVCSSPSRSGGDEEEHNGPVKLTRAQRKRLRKKKLKEVSSQRRKIIGPMLPPDLNNDSSVEIARIVTETAEQNAAATYDSSGKLDSFSKQNKVKHRRRSKKTAAGNNLHPSSVGISGSSRVEATDENER